MKLYAILHKKTSLLMSVISNRDGEIFIAPNTGVSHAWVTTNRQIAEMLLNRRAKDSYGNYMYPAGNMERPYRDMDILDNVEDYDIIDFEMSA